MFQKSIFFSWQSELSYGKHKLFIENAVKKVIIELNKLYSENDYILYERLEFDKDLMGEFGSPDIIDTVFKKIDSCSLFIADLSFTCVTEKRSFPNSNVLIELGYAIKVLGWKNIICLFNKDSGNLNDMPFDIRKNRITEYGFSKTTNKKENERVSSLLEDIVRLSLKNTLPSDHLKMELITHISDVISNLIKCIIKFLNGPNYIYEPKDLEKFLSNPKSYKLPLTVLGYQIFKNLDIYVKELEKISDNVIYQPYFSTELFLSIIKLKEAVSIYLSNFLSLRFFNINTNQTSEFQITKLRKNFYALIINSERKDSAYFDFDDIDINDLLKIYKIDNDLDILNILLLEISITCKDAIKNIGESLIEKPSKIPYFE